MNNHSTVDSILILLISLHRLLAAATMHLISSLIVALAGFCLRSDRQTLSFIVPNPSSQTLQLQLEALTRTLSEDRFSKPSSTPSIQGSKMGPAAKFSSWTSSVAKASDLITKRLMHSALLKSYNAAAADSRDTSPSPVGRRHDQLSRMASESHGGGGSAEDALLLQQGQHGGAVITQTQSPPLLPLQSLTRASLVSVWVSLRTTAFLLVSPQRIVQDELRARAEEQRAAHWSQPVNVVRALDILEHQQRAQQQQHLRPLRPESGDVHSWPLHGAPAELGEEAMLEEAEEPWPYVTVEDLSFFLSRLLSGSGGESPTGASSVGAKDLPLPLSDPLPLHHGESPIAVAAGPEPIPPPLLPPSSPPMGEFDRRSAVKTPLGGRTMEGPGAEGAWQHMMNKEIKGVKYTAWW